MTCNKGHLSVSWDSTDLWCCPACVLKDSQAHLRANQKAVLPTAQIAGKQLNGRGRIDCLETREKIIIRALVFDRTKFKLSVSIRYPAYEHDCHVFLANKSSQEGYKSKKQLLT